MKTIQKRDLIEALKPFDDIAYVTVQPNVENSVSTKDFKKAKESIREIEAVLEEFDEAEKTEDGLTAKEMVAMLGKIRESINNFGPIWENISQASSYETDISGVESKNDIMGRHAVII